MTGHFPKFWTAWAAENDSQALRSTILQAEAWVCAGPQTGRCPSFTTPGQGNTTTQFPGISRWRCLQPAIQSQQCHHPWAQLGERLSALLYCVPVKGFDSTCDQVFLILPDLAAKRNALSSHTSPSIPYKRSLFQTPAQILTFVFLMAGKMENLKY